MSDERFIAVSVGNTRARWGVFTGRDLDDPGAAPCDDAAAVAKAVLALAEGMHDAVAVMASVNPAAADAIADRLEKGGVRVAWIGRDVAIPLSHTLDDASTLGQDRALAALAAHRRAKQACVVIDAGTAITVNFVDGEGVFQGGVIAPGLALMLRAMQQGTAALPETTYEAPRIEDGPFGKNTQHAMRLGVRNAARGLVRETIERFAEAYGAYPQIVATGGDAAALFDGDDLVEAIVPDLVLLGVAEAWLAGEHE